VERIGGSTCFIAIKTMRFALMARLFCLCLALALLGHSRAAVAFTPPSQKRLEQILAEVDAYVPEVLARTGVPGPSVALVAEDKVVFLKGYGTRTQNGSLPVTPDTIFQIGSCSKAFSAARLGMLVDQGALGWNDRVMRHLPEFAMSSQWITDTFVVDDLMAHRSGLYEYARVLVPYRPWTVCIAPSPSSHGPLPEPGLLIKDKISPAKVKAI
jgi:CubicO group peptidase (beta-lactamase class C family)